MSRVVEAPAKAKKRSLDQLASEVDHLRQRVEDLEDLRDLNDAIQRNGSKPLIPLAKVRKDLDLE
jgi:cell division protein FtsB